MLLTLMVHSVDVTAQGRHPDPATVHNVTEDRLIALIDYTHSRGRVLEPTDVYPNSSLHSFRMLWQEPEKDVFVRSGRSPYRRSWGE